MGAKSSRPQAEGGSFEGADRRTQSQSIQRIEEEMVTFEAGKTVDSIYEEEEEVQLSPSCFFLMPPLALLGGVEACGNVLIAPEGSLQSTLGLGPPMLSASSCEEDEEDGNDQQSLSDHVNTSPRNGLSNAIEKIPACNDPTLSTKASETFASTLSLDSQSFPSLEGGFTGSETSSSTKKKGRERRNRMVDVYQTDSTMLWNDEGEEWSPLVFMTNQTRLQLPFRPCSRKWCTCQNDPTGHRRASSLPITHTQDGIANESASAHPDTPRTNAERFLKCGSPRRISAPHDHRRQRSDDLQGLWIPVEEAASSLQDDDQLSPGGKISPTPRELRWLVKSHSERNLSSSTAALDQDGCIVTCPRLPPAAQVKCSSTGQRSRALSEDLTLQQQPRISPPSPVHSGRKNSPVPWSSDSCIQKANPLIETSSSTASGSICHADDASTPVPVRPRANSRDFSSQAIQRVAVPTEQKSTSRSYRRLRSRSEDVIDMRPGEAMSSGTACARKNARDTPRLPQAQHRQRARSEDIVDQGNAGGLPTVTEPSDESSRGSSSNRSRANSRDASTPKRIHMLVEGGCFNRSKSSGGNARKSTPRSPTSVLAIQHTNSSASENAPNMPSQPHPAERCYKSKLALLRVSIDGLRRHRDSKVQVITTYHEMAWLHFQNFHYDAALCVVNHALELLYLTQGPADCGKGCLTLSETLTCVVDSMKPLLADLLLTKARIVLSSQQASAGVEETEIQYDGTDPFQRSKFLSQTAVALLQPLLRQQFHADLLAIVAKGLALLGRIYCQEGFAKPGIAMDHFQQATNMFQSLAKQEPLKYQVWFAETALYVGNLHMEQGLLDSAKDSYWHALRLYRCVYQRGQGALSSSVLMDMATTLTNLGWLHLQECDLTLAHHSTIEALYLLQYYHGENQSSVGSSANAAGSLRNLASVEYQLGMIASCAGRFREALSFWKAALKHQQLVLCADHPDMAITMEAIGSTYQQLYQWNKARDFLQGAIDVRKRASTDTIDVARLQSRLSLVLLELKEYDRAKRLLARAAKRYKLGSVPLDYLGQRARKWLSQLRDDEHERLNG